MPPASPRGEGGKPELESVDTPPALFGWQSSMVPCPHPNLWHTTREPISTAPADPLESRAQCISPPPDEGLADTFWEGPEWTADSRDAWDQAF